MVEQDERLTRNDLRAVNELVDWLVNRNELSHRSRKLRAHIVLIPNQGLPLTSGAVVAGKREVGWQASGTGDTLVKAGLDKELGVEVHWCGVEGRTLVCASDTVSCTDGVRREKVDNLNCGETDIVESSDDGISGV